MGSSSKAVVLAPRRLQTVASIAPGGEDLPIVVRVLHKWYVYQKWNPNYPVKAEMVFVDAEVTQLKFVYTQLSDVHAIVYSEVIPHTFENYDYARKYVYQF